MMNKDELKQKLTPEQYAVACEGSTEAPFTGKYWDHHEDGTYHCVVCGVQLFSSQTKFDSGSGWPSFTEVMNDKSVRTLSDDSHGMHRVEVRCANCDAHLGHVFPDGPTASGMRYCINSAALNFEKEDQTK